MLTNSIANKIIFLAEKGYLKWNEIAVECLARMSEHDINMMLNDTHWLMNWYF